VSDEPLALLEKHFGFSEFLPGQLQVIDALRAGHSAAAVFPTGGGKSLCYQLPALGFDGLTLVVSPLIALMKDQIDALLVRGIRARRLDSTLSADEYRDVVHALRSSELQLLYVAPERFNNERFRGLLESLRISLFAVDEAHCISEWGHNFRPDYLKLARFVRECGAERVLALTATATEEVLRDVCRNFEISPENAVRTPFYRANLRLLATPVIASERETLLEARFRERPPGATIVYVTLQRSAEAVRDRLIATGLDARAYHAGMTGEDRAAVQDWFFASDAAIVVATIAFGMGIDKPNIRYVYHFNPPKSLEGYAQEIGRAGRDGEAAICEMLVCLDDLNTLENFAYGDTPSRAAIERLVSKIFDLGVDFDVSLHKLAANADIRLLVVRTLLTYLELDGYLEGGTPLYSEYEFQPKMSSTEILSEFEGAQQQFLGNILRRSKKGRTWFAINVDETARALDAPRARVVQALEELHERGMLEVRAKGVRQRYRRVREPESIAELVDSLAERATRREEAEIRRLADVIDWVRLDRCQVRALGTRFGDEEGEPCGHCSWCEDGQASQAATARTVMPIPDDVWERAMEARKEHDSVLGEPRALARFLCGVGSPWLTRAKLTRHQLFGCLRDVRFSEILARARLLDVL